MRLGTTPLMEDAKGNRRHFVRRDGTSGQHILLSRRGGVSSAFCLSDVKSAKPIITSGLRARARLCLLTVAVWPSFPCSHVRIRRLHRTHTLYPDPTVTLTHEGTCTVVVHWKRFISSSRTWQIPGSRQDGVFTCVLSRSNQADHNRANALHLCDPTPG